MKKVDKKKNPGLAKLPTAVRNKMGYMKKGGRVSKSKMKRKNNDDKKRPGLWANINRRKN
jgi:hypothetical protein